MKNKNRPRIIWIIVYQWTHGHVMLLLIFSCLTSTRVEIKYGVQCLCVHVWFGMHSLDLKG